MKNNTPIAQIGLGLMLAMTQQQTWGSDSLIQMTDFTHITNIAVAADRSVWITDAGLFKHISPAGKLIEAFKPVDFAPDYAVVPALIALALDGSVWVANARTAVTRYTPYLQHYSTHGTLLHQFDVDADIFDLKVASDGSVWVAFLDKGTVKHYTATGKLLKQLEHFDKPEHIALAKDGSVWVSDGSKLEFVGHSPFPAYQGYNYRLHHFNADGGFITQFETQASTNLYDKSFGISAVDVAVDGSVWVADKTSSFKQFTPDGSLIKRYGLGAGNAESTSVALAADGSVWTVGYYRSNNDYAIRQFNADGRLAVQVKNYHPCTTDYDELPNTLYLWGVALASPNPANTLYYDAVLQYLNGRYNLLSATLSDPNKVSTTLCNTHPLYFDPSSNILNIPEVYVGNARYKATLKNTGNYSFELQSATQ